MRFFKRKPETPAQIRAEKALDEVTREVAWEEFDKEGGRGFTRSPLRFRRTRLRKVPGDPVPEPVDDPDPSDKHGLRETLHDPKG